MKCEVVDSFEMLISYYQVAVTDMTLERPCNDWRPEHVAQGFSWRRRSVSFATVDILPMRIEVCLADSLTVKTNVVRAIRVPFSVVSGAELEIATIGFEHGIRIPVGEYALTFEHGLKDSSDIMWCIFTFVPDSNANAEILIADPELSPPTKLVMMADSI